MNQFKHDGKAVKAAAEKVLAEKLAEGYVLSREIEYWPGTAYIAMQTPEKLRGEFFSNYSSLNGVKRELRDAFVAWLRAGFDGKIDRNYKTNSLLATWKDGESVRRARHQIRVSDHASTQWRADGEIDAFYLIRENGEVVQTII